MFSSYLPEFENAFYSVIVFHTYYSFLKQLTHLLYKEVLFEEVECPPNIKEFALPKQSWEIWFRFRNVERSIKLAKFKIIFV